MSVTVRYEYFQDEGDTKLGFDDLDSSFVNASDDGTLESFTITPEMAVGGGVLRAEYRMDFANFKAFQAGEGTTPQNKSQKTASLQYIVIFFSEFLIKFFKLRPIVPQYCKWSFYFFKKFPRTFGLFFISSIKSYYDMI